jgi:predicted RNA-binding Zn-ribbon protein involved in translation (DUF1610 family)
MRVAAFDTSASRTVEVTVMLANLRIRSDGDLQCPRCGILSGVQAAMTCRPGQPTLDLFQCDTCGFDMDVPAFAGRSA